MAQRVKGIKRITHVQRRGEQPQAGQHERPGSRQQRATLRIMRAPERQPERNAYRPLKEQRKNQQR